jgi:uncharacterized protein
MSHHPGKFNWFDHLSRDPAQAQGFYRSLFGWTTHAISVGTERYELIHNGGEAIAGLRTVPAGLRSGWNGFISVPDVDASFEAALAAGATSLWPPTDFGNVGRSATIADPAGAALSLWRGSEDDRPDLERSAVGDWCWSELLTQDVARCLAFYEHVFGYRSEAMQLPGGGAYHILKSADGKARGGITKAAHAHAKPLWMPYVRVENADAIAARVAPLGGKLTAPATEIARVGRFGALLDPLGAELGFLQPAVIA